MEEIAGPVDFEVALGCAGFVAGSGVEGATPGDRPGDDLEILLLACYLVGVRNDLYAGGELAKLLSQ